MASFTQRPFDLPLQGQLPLPSGQLPLPARQITLPSTPMHPNSSKETLQAQVLLKNTPRGSDDSKRSKGLGLSFSNLLGKKNSGERMTKNIAGDKPKKRGPKPDSKPAVNRRQELNRQAQRTHRERKELYTKGLESQIVELKDALKVVEAERNKYQHENGILKELLSVNGIPFIPTPATIDDLPIQRNNVIVPSQEVDTTWNNLEYNASAYNGMEDTSPATTTMSFSIPQSGNESLSAAHTPTFSPTDSSGLVNTAFNNNNNNNNNYAGTSAPTAYHPTNASIRATMASNGQQFDQASSTANLSMIPTSNTYNGGSSHQQATAPANPLGAAGQMSATQPLQKITSYGAPGINHDEVGIAFVLALEESCKDHAAFMMKRAVDTTSTELSGHALMMSCPSYDQIMAQIDNPDAQFPHRMPDVPAATLNRWMMSSADMDLGGEVTPVMALKMIRADERYDLMSLAELEELKDQLKVKSRCYGFGAVLEEYEVRDVIDQVMGDKVKKLKQESDERMNATIDNLKAKALGLQNHSTGQHYNTVHGFEPGQGFLPGQNYESAQTFVAGQNLNAADRYTSAGEYNPMPNFNNPQNLGPGPNFDGSQHYDTVQDYNVGQQYPGGQNYGGNYL